MYFNLEEYLNNYSGTYFLKEKKIENKLARVYYEGWNSCSKITRFVIYYDNTYYGSIGFPTEIENTKDIIEIGKNMLFEFANYVKARDEFEEIYDDCSCALCDFENTRKIWADIYGINSKIYKEMIERILFETLDEYINLDEDDKNAVEKVIEYLKETSAKKTRGLFF